MQETDNNTPPFCVPPQDLEAEQSVIGSALIDDTAAKKVCDDLQPHDFYKEAHRTIWKAIRTVADNDEPVDLITVSSVLRGNGEFDAVGGAEYLTAVIDCVPTSAHIMRYAQIIKERAVLRRLIDTGTKIVKMGYDGTSKDVDDVLDEAERMVHAVRQRRMTSDFEHVAPIMNEVFTELDRRQTSGGGVTGVRTGINALDEFLGGLMPGSLVVVAGRPSMGKSSVAMLNTALNAALYHNVPVGIFSIEEPATQIVEGWLSVYSGVNAWKMRNGTLFSDEWSDIAQAIAAIRDAPLFIDDTSGISTMEMKSKARRLKAMHDIGLYIIDHLQIASAGFSDDQRYAEVTSIVRSLKSLARELSVPVMVCSQLSRNVEQREDKRPRLADLRESGAIEQEADVVIFLYRDAYYKREKEKKEGEQVSVLGPEEAELIVAKHRSGPVGTVHCMFDGRCRRFYDVGGESVMRKQKPPKIVDTSSERPPTREQDNPFDI